MNESITVVVPTGLPPFEHLSGGLVRHAGGVGTMDDYLKANLDAVATAMPKFGSATLSLAKAMVGTGVAAADMAKKLQAVKEVFEDKTIGKEEADAKADALAKMFGSCDTCHGKGVTKHPTHFLGGHILSACPDCAEPERLKRRTRGG